MLSFHNQKLIVTTHIYEAKASPLSITVVKYYHHSLKLYSITFTAMYPTVIICL